MPSRCGDARSPVSGFLTPAASAHPQYRTDVSRLDTGTRGRPGRPADRGMRPGAVRVRVTSAARDRGNQDRQALRVSTGPGATPATEALSEIGDGNEHRQTGNGEHGICAQAAGGKAA